MTPSEENPIYLITGIMAAGKSTVAEKLAQRFPKSVHLRGDLYRKMIISGRADMTANPTPEAIKQLNLRYDLAAHTADAYHKAGFTVVWQDVMVGKILPEVIARIQSRPLYIIILCPTPETVAAREATRPKTGYGGGFTPQNFHQLLLTDTPPIGLWLDTSTQTPEETTNQILLHTQNGEGRINS